MKHFTLASFGVERRMAAVVLFRGSQLESARLRHLPLDPSKASDTMREFVRNTLEHHAPEFVAISCPSNKAGERVRSSCGVIEEIATGLGIPAVKVDDTALMDAYGCPPLTRKENVRRAGFAIWPSLNHMKSKRAIVDAATAGLHVQTERLFSIYSDQP
jgi:hypothetical protein